MSCTFVFSAVTKPKVLQNGTWLKSLYPHLVKNVILSQQKCQNDIFDWIRVQVTDETINFGRSSFYVALDMYVFGTDKGLSL